MKLKIHILLKLFLDHFKLYLRKLILFLAQINMNMLFNNDLIKNTYDKWFWIPRFHGLFSSKTSTFSIEYPNEVQLYLKENLRKVLKEIVKSK